jgi:TonB family protein
MFRTQLYGAPAHKATRCASLLLISICAALPAMAQTAAPDPAAPSEAARRAAMGPFRMILQDSAAPKRQAPPPKKAAAKPEGPAAGATAGAPAAPAAPSAPVAAAAPGAPAAPAAPAAAAAPAAVAAALPSAPPPKQARTALVPIKQEPPELTAALLREQAKGVVKVAFEVRPDGSTGDVRIVSSTNRKLNAVSTGAVSNWKFQPIDEPKAVEIEFAFN